MTWLTGAGDSLCNLFQSDKKMTTATSTPLGILCFEAAKTMSRLVSLYRSLSDDEIRRLRIEVVRSSGVAYLNSRDEDHLLRLACAELLDDLNHVAASVARLGEKCSDTTRGLLRFDLLHGGLKLGLIDSKKIKFRSRNVQIIVQKMERLVSVTANLYSAWESLSELEHSKKKINEWKIANIDLFHEKIFLLQKQVQSYKEASLWSKTYDESLGLMARLVCVVYARIYVVFGSYYISGLQCSPTEYCLLEERYFHLQKTKRAWKTTSPMGLARFYGFDRITGGKIGKSESVSRLAPQSTVGGSALTVRYANVIILAERCLYAPETVDKDTRDGLYEMLPESLRRTVRAKLRKRWGEEEGGRDGHALAEGWRDAVEEMMTWLAPLAHDTMTWQAERKLEWQQRYFGGVGKSVLLMQTLHFSDLEKTEAAIVEVLVGLSCVFRYVNLRRSGDHHHHCDHPSHVQVPVGAGYNNKTWS